MVKNKKKNKTKLFLLGMICFNLMYLIGSFDAFSADLSTKAVLKRDGQNLVLSANNKNYKLSCKTPGCIVYKCIEYACKDDVKTLGASSFGCSQSGVEVKCIMDFRVDGGCDWNGGDYNYKDNVYLRPGADCYVSGYRRKSFNWGGTGCDWNESWYGFQSTKYCIKTECMTNGCTEWEINGKDFLSLFPSVGMATIDPNNIEF